MSADNARPDGCELSEGLGPAPERAAFDRWLRDNGHCEDQHDDMLMPLQRSINNLMWSAWQAAVAVERERWRSAAHRAVTAGYDELPDALYALDELLRA